MKGVIPSKTRYRPPKPKPDLKRNYTCSACIHYGNKSPLLYSDCPRRKWGMSVGCNEHTEKDYEQCS